MTILESDGPGYWSQECRAPKQKLTKGNGMESVIWHFGTHKTGSTSFQRWLGDNQSHPESNFYLSTYHGQPHKELANLLNNPASFLEPLRKDVSGRDKLVISLEQTTHELARSLARVLSVIEHFNSVGLRVRMIGLLRRQDAMKESVYAEIVKNGFVGSIWEDHHYPLAYASWLLPLADAIRAGDNQLDIGVYREGEDSLRHLVDMAKLRGGNVDSFPRSNVSPSRQKTLLLSAIADREQKRRVLGSFNPRFSNLDNLPVMSPGERRMIQRSFKESNNKLRPLLSDQDLAYLLDESAQDEDWFPARALSPEDLLEAIRIMGENCQ